METHIELQQFHKFQEFVQNILVIYLFLSNIYILLILLVLILFFYYLHCKHHTRNAWKTNMYDVLNKFCTFRPNYKTENINIIIQEYSRTASIFISKD